MQRIVAVGPLSKISMMNYLSKIFMSQQIKGLQQNRSQLRAVERLHHGTYSSRPTLSVGRTCSQEIQRDARLPLWQTLSSLCHQYERLDLRLRFVGPLLVPSSLADEQVLFLSDILPTGYQAVLNAEVKAGSTMAIFGAGPVGLMSAACAQMKGAEKIYMIDHYPYRLEFARETYGIIPINFDDTDAAQFIISDTQGRGVDFEAKGSALETVLTGLKMESSSGSALRQCIAAVRRGGVVSVPGVYSGFIHGFLFGDAFDKGLTIRMGQTHVQKFMPELLGLIEEGKLRPDAIITHRMKLSEASEAYKIFDKKEQDVRI